MVQRKEPKLTT